MVEATIPSPRATASAETVDGVKSKTRRPMFNRRDAPWRMIEEEAAEERNNRQEDKEDRVASKVLSCQYILRPCLDAKTFRCKIL